MEQINLQNILIIIIIAFVLTSIYYLINIGNKHVGESNKIILSRVNIIRTLILIISVIFVIFIFKKYPIILSTIITLILSVVVAYIINPLVNYFEKKLNKRAYAILVSYLIIFGFFIILIGLVVPITIDELKKLLRSLPNILNEVEKTIDSIAVNFTGNNEQLAVFYNNISEGFQEYANKIQISLFKFITELGSNASGYASVFIRIALIPVVSFYILLDKDKLISKIKSLSIYKNNKVSNLFKDIDESMSEFVRARILMAIFVGVVTTIVLLILGIDFALVIGLITMIADIIPYIGPFLGFVPAIVLALIKGPYMAILVAILFVAIQWVENNVIGPRILGKSVGLHPLVILLSLIIGGGMFGVAGMIFSVPVVATGKVVIKHLGPTMKEKFLI